MAPPSSVPLTAKTSAIDAGAVAHLRYIRETIEAAHTFTSVPGKGCVAMGVTGLAAATLAAHWFWVWLGAAVVAVALVPWFLIAKARQQGLSLWRGVARRFFLTLTPAFLAGAVLTVALYHHGALALIPGAWLMLYGAGLAASGVYSLAIVSLAGFGFMLLGGIALALPVSFSTALLGIGFGGLHLVLGAAIIRRHGG
jgi:hypothetical protein